MCKTFIVVGVFIVFDVATGLMKAWHSGVLDSTKLRAGLFRKLSEALSVIGSALLEHGIKYINLNIEVPLLTAVSAYICIMELISIIENLCAVNEKLNKLFIPYLKKLKGANQDEKGN